ncbi:MAG: hypothetical protein ACR2LA_04430 [Acidimicrobiales bacterium]
MRLEGARTARVTGRGQLSGYHNYLLGDDPTTWATHVPLYREVVLENVYDGVDLKVYNDDGLPGVDLRLRPGADRSQVRVRWEGADAAGNGHELSGAFTTTGADPHRAAVPAAVLWSTFLAGNHRDIGRAVAGGPNGTVTVTGYTLGLPDDSRRLRHDHQRRRRRVRHAAVRRRQQPGVFHVHRRREERPAHRCGGHPGRIGHRGRNDVEFGLPTTPDAYDSRLGGDRDAFVARLSPDGASLRYATFLGGRDSDYGYSVDVGPEGFVTISGATYSSDFPTTPGAYDTSFNNSGSFGTDGYVVRLSAPGSALDYGTFLGGAAGDYAYDVAVGPTAGPPSLEPRRVRTSRRLPAPTTPATTAASSVATRSSRS